MATTSHANVDRSVMSEDMCKSTFRLRALPTLLLSAATAHSTPGPPNISQHIAAARACRRDNGAPTKQARSEHDSGHCARQHLHSNSPSFPHVELLPVPTHFSFAVSVVAIELNNTAEFSNHAIGGSGTSESDPVGEPFGVATALTGFDCPSLDSCVPSPPNIPRTRLDTEADELMPCVVTANGLNTVRTTSVMMGSNDPTPNSSRMMVNLASGQPTRKMDG